MVITRDEVPRFTAAGGTSVAECAGIIVVTVRCVGRKDAPKGLVAGVIGTWIGVITGQRLADTDPVLTSIAECAGVAIITGHIDQRLMLTPDLSVTPILRAR